LDLPFWVNQIDKMTNSVNATRILFGNKADEPSREVTTEEINLFARENNMEYFEVSAKRGSDLHEIVDPLLLKIWELKAPPDESLTRNDKIRFNRVEDTERKSFDKNCQC